MKLRTALIASAGLLTLAACQTVTSDQAIETEEINAAAEASEVQEADLEVEEEVASPEVESEKEYTQTNAEKLWDILDDQPDEVKARYDARHPYETLTFFGIEPGMNVMEALPGGGWYSKLLMPYIGAEATFTGGQYPDEIWPIIFPDADAERLAGFASRGAAWAETAQGWGVENAPEINSYFMTKADAETSDLFDAALFIRALHNLNRSEAEYGLMAATIAETYRLMKPGGIVGVVQHRAGEDTPDDWAGGPNGYLKQSYVVEVFENAGFVLEAESDINANPADTAGEGDMVWRLPPSLMTTQEGTPEQAAMIEIGESDRMTLRFRKPE
ncbi:MAG: hypothetical protein Hens3KO_07530 [Henriciella sp.]